MKENLTQKEKLFCSYYAQTRNLRESAARAGYSLHPEKTALRLINKKAIKNEIENKIDQSKFKNEVAVGLRRLAFGSVSDPVKLLLMAESDIFDIESLDLFNVSEIKRPKAGGMEIKFFDRFKALEKLMSISQDSQADGAMPFYKALEKGAKEASQFMGGEVDY